MKFEAKEEASRLIKEERKKLSQHRRQTMFNAEAGDLYVSAEVADTFDRDEIQELLDCHFRGDLGEAEPFETDEAARSLFAVDGCLVWVVTFFRPHVTVVTFTVFS
jgi:hypothetical protein